MRIAWFTPFWKESAIGTFSRHIAERLSEAHEVELWVPEAADCQLTELPVVEFDPERFGSELPPGIDVAVYNLGNNAAFHAAILRVARNVPGIVILHDAVLHHLFLDASRQNGSHDLECYSSALTRWYGQDVSVDALRLVRQDGEHGYPPIDFCARYPLLEEATLGALGVVVHSEAQYERVTPWWLGPIARLDLPSYQAERVVARPKVEVSVSDKLNVLSIGWVGQAKQTHIALQALASRPELAGRIHYRIAGPVDLDSEYGREVLEIIKTGELESCVEFLGYVEENELERLIDWADVFINLRWPSTEGGSAALAEQLIRAKPVIVTRSGLFAELPDEAVIKVPPDDPAAVADALERLLDSGSLRSTIGDAAWETARRHTVERYARGLEAIAEKGPDWALLLAVLDRVGDVLAMLHADPALGVFETVGAELSQVFGPEFAQGRPMRRSAPG